MLFVTGLTNFNQLVFIKQIQTTFNCVYFVKHFKNPLIWKYFLLV